MQIEDRRKYQREWCRANPELVRGTRKRHYDKQQAVIRNLKAQPCKDCGRRYPHYVMDFDHVRGQKLFGIGDNIRKGITLILQEAAKCDVVCANCHRERTHKGGK